MHVLGYLFDIVSRVIFAALLGFLIGYGLAWAVSSGYFQTWRQLPSPLAKAVALLTAANESIYIKAVDDQTYRCTDWKNECWVRETASSEPPTPSTVTRPCSPSVPEFFFMAHAPLNVVDCLQMTMLYADAYGRSAYILDKDGRLWIWSHIMGGYTSLFLVYLFPGIGTIVVSPLV